MGMVRTQLMGLVQRRNEKIAAEMSSLWGLFELVFSISTHYLFIYERLWLFLRIALVILHSIEGQNLFSRGS
ncbi:hypothetical protein BH10PLA2_BH10PLA2_30030 [soil metagenome]